MSDELTARTDSGPEVVKEVDELSKKKSETDRTKRKRMEDPT